MLSEIRKIEYAIPPTKTYHNPACIAALPNTSDNQALLATMLLKWTNRFIALKSRELETTAERRAELKRSVLVKWARRGRVLADKQRLAQSFADLRTEAQLRDVLLYWRERASRQRERKERLGEVLKTKRMEALRATWDTWRGRVIENQLAHLVCLAICCRVSTNHSRRARN